MPKTDAEEKLAKQLGVEFKNPARLHQALVHRSYLNENAGEDQSNERLEFLGDAVLEFLVSRKLFEVYPNLAEGVLTNLRANLVNTGALASVAKSLGLGEVLCLSKGEDKGGGRQNESLLADTFEALVGAIYIDQGLAACDSLLEKLVFTQLASVDIENLKDAKSRLQELVQEKDWPTPTYHLVKSEGPDHAKRFWVEAKTGEMSLGVGEGESKQQAEQQAAKIALENLHL